VNYYVQARERWERQQNEMHGCVYVQGICTVHDRVAGTTGKKGSVAAKIADEGKPPKVRDFSLAF
jgi:hypothetical protein